MAYSKKQLIEEIHRLTNGNKPPSLSDMETHGKYSGTPYYNHFGSWNNALEAAGFDLYEKQNRKFPEKIGKKELIDEIHRLANEDIPPSLSDLEERGKYSASPYSNHFGSWNNALETAGYDLEKQNSTPPNKINKEELINEIHRLADGDVPPSANMMNQRGKYSTGPYYATFGSWTKAVKEAGYSPRGTYTEEELLNEIHRLAEGDTPPTANTDLNKRGNITIQPFINHFGSWNKAIQAAGYEPHTTHSREELLGIIHKLADGNIPPTSKELKSEGVSATSYIYYFGSWNKAIKEAGYEVQHPRNVSKKDLIKEIQNIGGERAPPAWSDMEESQYSISTYCSRFGGWENAVKEAGYEDTLNGCGFRDETLLDEIRHLGDNKNPPSIREMVEQGEFSIYRYEERWETWAEAVRAAGYENVGTQGEFDSDNSTQTKLIDYSNKGDAQWTSSINQLLLEEIRDLAEGGKPPTKDEMRIKSDFSLHRYQKRWKSWNQAIRAAGLEPNHEINIKKERLIEALQELGDKLGRTPRADEVNELGQYSVPPYERKFGSWWAALVESGFRPQRMYPLTPEAFQKLFETAVADKQHRTEQSILTLLFQFTGIPPSAAVGLSQDMVYDLNGDVGIRLPADQTKNKSLWEFLIPEYWHDPVKGKKRETQLTGFLQWYFDEYDEIYSANRRTSTHGILYDIALDAGLLQYRQSINYHEKEVPKVTPIDLRFTHGIHLRTNGAPDDYIRQRLGLDYYGSYITLEKIDFWISQNSNLYHQAND